ncbi:MAG: ribonuclease BN/unknown domain fusion protein [Methanomethylovorans sp. PtaU1.Bin093]|uniref:YihY/virulence factor BrkB family protein n=1 Tax=Methanomethylovorans sp. PtaU1.Bin093 TaxID=1811679 RepID=UPI0009CEC81E|nr:YihY/virulence factor BrkB family protein [Methanomethylovorans sp. PtaU1.Bin093]OPY19893.1 MAG: ribonuclease BN/unknown domain fusion protein [Methanomethylovorans sp. PtaU1.Bin093]
MSTQRIKEITVSTLKQWRDNNSMTDSAALSFYLLMSLPAILLFSVSIGSLFLGSGQVPANIAEYMEGVVDPTLLVSLNTFLTNVPETASLSLSALTGILLLMWSAGNVFRQFKKFLDKIWKVPVSKGNFARNFLEDMVLSLLTVVIFGGLVVVSTLLEALMLTGSRLLYTHIPFSGGIQYAGTIAAFMVLVMLFTFIYLVLPDVDLCLICVVSGSVMTAFLITIGKYAIVFYMAHSDLTSVYGIIGSVIGLLLWIYYSSIVITMGAEFIKVYSSYLSEP